MARAQPKQKAVMGRPKLPFDQKQFEALCSIQCTEEEIASVLNVSVDTLERRCKEFYGLTFADVYKEKAAGGKVSLRREQFRLALGGNTTMLIWLGKQNLGQTDTGMPKEDGSGLRQLADAIRGIAHDRTESPKPETAPGD